MDLNNEKRRLDIDNIKGILIYLVVYGHFIFQIAQKGSGVCYSLDAFIYSFHMPLFLFCSGFVAKCENIKKSCVSYIVIFMSYNFLYALFDYFSHGTELKMLEPYYSMWFLLTLVSCYILLGSGASEKKLFIISIVSSLVLMFFPIDNNLALGKTIAFSPCFFFAVFIRKKLIHYKDSRLDKTKKIIITALLCYLLLILLALGIKSGIPMGFFLISKVDNIIIGLLRVFLLMMSFGIATSAFLVVPNRRIWGVTTLGQNTLTVYLIHRIITLYVPIFTEDKMMAVYAVPLSLGICIILGNGYINQYLKRKKILIGISCIMSICIIGVNLDKSENGYIYEEQIANCTKFSYIGDLILFQQDIANAKCEDGEYRFEDYFTYTKEYLGDYTFAVLEGPVSDSRNYSTGNYYDSFDLRFNYPSSFLREVANNVNFVSIAQNHLLDQGASGLIDTINNLNEIGIDYTGASLPTEEKEIKVIEVNGIKCAVLAYTSFMNHTEEYEPYMYSYLDEDTVKREIEMAKKAGVDCIFAMIHLGEQFNHDVTYEQKYWAHFLANNDVDIVMMDHAHVTEPLEYLGDTVVFYCPGNYASYLDVDDQNYGAICNFYVDNDTKRVMATSIVPIETVKTSNKYSYPVVSYEINDIAASNIVTSSMIGVTYNYVLPEYYVNNSGICRFVPDKTISLVESQLAEYNDDKTICFVGDSVTEGAKNGGIGWYESLKIENTFEIAKSGATSESIYDVIKETVNATSYDCYVIAVGVNDIRYNSTEAKEYIENVKKLVDLLGKEKKYVFLSPWPFLEGDPISCVSDMERLEYISSYSKELEIYCEENNYLFVNVSDYLLNILDEQNYYLYMQDYVHPNNSRGVELYAEAFMKMQTMD